VNLVDEGFDMAVRVGRPGDSSLIVRRLCAVRIVVVATPAYVEDHAPVEKPEDLMRHACIIDTNFREPEKWPFRHPSGKAYTAGVTGRIRYSNTEACLQAAEEGLGIACLPGFVAGEAIRSGRVVRLLRDFESEPYDVHVLYPHNRHLAAKVRLLVDALVERYRGVPAWEAGW
jgi:DNA-binding transcriptional LysR family regulator